MREDRPLAEQFFAAYFHQDCLADDSDWQSIVVRFRDSEPADTVARTRAALARLNASLSDAELEALLFGRHLQCLYDPLAEGVTVRAWLLEILHLLAGGSPRTSESDNVLRARRDAASLARAAVDGTLDPVLAARQLSQLRFACGVPEDDPDFLCFIVIDSETDALPVGQERELWSSEALKRLEQDVVEARRYAFEQGRQAFANVALRFQGAG